MLDEDNQIADPEHRVAGGQLSLAEIFFVTTLTAVAIWLYVYVSPIIALLAGGGILFVAIIRQLGRRPVFVGGIAGFVVAAVLSWLICAIGEVEMGITVSVLLITPSLGYVVGAFMTELAEDDCL